MTQILGTGEGKTSSAAKEPVVERKPAQVFFESMALAASMSGYYAGPTATTLGNSLSLGAGTAAGVGEGVAGARVLAAPNPLTVALLAIFYSPSLNEGETETLQNIRGDQLYQNLIHGQMMVGAFTRVNSTVIQGDYVPEYELREIARQNGTVRTRVRFRIEEDPESGELVSRSYEVGEKSGLDRVRVRFAKQLDKETWGFEDPSIKGTFVWSRSAGQGKFEWGASQTTVHDGSTGGSTTPPTPIPEPRSVWGLPNPAPASLPPVPGTPIPEEQGPNIETLPIEDRDFNDFIIVDPMGGVPAIYVYFKKAPAGFLETGYYNDFDGRSREGMYEVDHLPSKAAVREYLINKYPEAEKDDIKKLLGKVAVVSIPIDVHRDCSETFGGRNNSRIETENGETISKKELDARDLEFAVDSNWNANAKCLKERYGISDEKIEEVRAKLHDLNRRVGLY
ncbi:TPA: S-type pyocin domain-containing protein [Klebsiella pneumoniae]|nr:S-type pyocin domain-containing protein [Klebsiella pneumoniae]MCA4998389.1 S-type pyocin domain-containing protein [Klebsiella pneumoniae]UZI53115.1 S-type pyocin domain-containing protein [Klebsiella pneumoniae]SVS90292.1 S-type Pyocin [Klebsiella pneumoniae]HBQ5238941.1 S-type pyocin domain-containing protein [Klebsiella pneumoniae]HBR6908819.1 S-type pyocin domain-containing protein [Klebsiella pneumoniae]